MRERELILVIGLWIALGIALVLLLRVVQPAGAQSFVPRETLTPDPDLPPGVWPTPSPWPTNAPWPTATPGAYPWPGEPPRVFAVSPAQLTATWQGRAVVVTWQGAPAGSCLYLRGRFVPVPCGASGRAVLPVGGVDGAYAPRGGDQLALAVDTTRGPNMRASVPMVRIILPLVVRE